MGNVLDHISKDNTRFTIFENDQVLTADHLNDLVNYLDVQSRLTRTQAIGVGIITGLEIGLLDNKHVVVSKGAAITTDGDLVQFANDQEFDQYDVFEDANAKYSYFHLDTDQPIPLFELRNSQLVGAVPGKDLATLEDTTGTAFKDYVGILYLEDYDNDEDLCTGTDCDNKGIIAVKELKVLLVHKNNVNTLLQSMPSLNKDYFALDDLNIPRVTVSTAIDTYAELNASFNNALAIKDDIKAKLAKAYQTCQLIVEDEFEAGDPTSGWNTLLDQHFTAGVSTTTQYVYDFARDLSYAYNEMRESLFSDDMLSLPDVDLFPKHVLLGLIRDASLKNPIIPFPDIRILPGRDIPIIPTRTIDRLINPRINLFSNIRFNLGTLIKRFNPIHIDLEYRHHFYESPILNNNNEADELTRFCFMRIHSMITNFHVPTSDELQNIDTALKIIPGYQEDSPLGQRSIPFYYRYNATFPLNLYWNFNANTRKKENQILSYNANLYSNNPATLTPLLYNILPFNFFRIEGHIGFTLSAVEAALNKIILDNNLPINIQSVQVEKKIETIPIKPWFFPHLYMYEKSVKSTFIDRMNDADTVNDELVQDTANDNPVIPVSEFKTAKQNVLDNARDVGDPQFNFVNYRSAVSNMFTAASNVKAQTKQYTFSNTAIPHDFILNSDILRKTDVISGIFQETLNKKKAGLTLGNFMKDNPGLEHVGGSLRGGTFVLVYTADDKKVVADFMLPYASIDKDVVPDPPVYKPLPLPLPEGTPIIPKFPIRNVFEIKPYYVKNFDDRIAPYVKIADIDTKVASTVDLKLAVTNAKIDGLTPQIASFDQRLKDNSSLFNSVLSKDLSKVALPSAGLNLGGRDFTADLNALHEKQSIIQNLAPDAPDRQVKENELLQSMNDLTDKLNQPAVLQDPTSAIGAKSILADVQSASTFVQNPALKDQAGQVSEKALNAIKSFNLRR
ncbi:hypothetical protein GS399_01730 [Pedobacter sp. HMF7647]|uniref:Uncharacterized protein n=1 Tax=Hufsiella arboris TaxID=2695275 RepID=A0A7K1Y514_9SPHI|nr:hypothetical protein [Hufsiella arboris]MXV49676.1 hypothetical protein [Hufsiella arboris]